MSNKQDWIIPLVSIIGLVCAVYFIGAIGCNLKSESFENHKFNLFSGCMVKHKGKWLPLDNIRGFD